MEAPAEPRHRTFGTTLSEWISLTPRELPIDAVGLWQIVKNLESGYGLSGKALEDAVRSSVEALLAAGALPVQGSRADSRWHLRSDLAKPQEQVLEKVMAYWKTLGRDPDVGDIWFAKREMYEE